MFARDVHVIQDHTTLLRDSKRIDEVRALIEAGDVFIAKRVFEPAWIERIKTYLSGVGRNSLPQYRPIENDCPNFHRVNRWDERSHVKACFHQFSFFPWNQDTFDLFGKTQDVYRVKNLLSRNPAERFMGTAPEDGCTRRLSFQFYPQRVGGMNKHQDPVDHHQMAAPSLVMSKKGLDFSKGGIYVEKITGEKTCLDDAADIGDVIYYNARTPHGVERIDPDTEEDWLSFRGRWTMLFAVNKLADNARIPASVDLEAPGRRA